jgi:hypothetical protein
VRGDVGQADRKHDDRRGDRRGDAEQQAAPVAPGVVAFLAPRPPQRDRAEAEEQHAGQERDQPGEVVAGRPDLHRVMHGLDPGGDSEDAEEERHGAAPSAPRPWVRPRG